MKQNHKKIYWCRLEE